MCKYIVTHPGGAHKDDFLAVCVLAAQHGVPVYRRDPTPAEVADPTVALVDIGASDDGALMNFDHHHFPREHAPTCSLSLLLKHLGLYEDALLFCPWLEPAEWFDSRGPQKTAQWLGIQRNVIPKMNSPIDVTLLRRFAAHKELKPGETLYEVMRFVGQDLLEYLKSIRARIEVVAKRVQRWDVKVGNATLPSLFMPRNEGEVDEPSAGLAQYIRASNLEKEIVAMVYPDRRSEGYGIGRYEDHPHLDFSQLEGQPDVHFAHKSGFMCKTTANTPARLQALIAGAYKA